MSGKLGPCYFGHPEKKNDKGHKETVYLGTLFDNKFDPNDPRKDLSLSIKDPNGNGWLRASAITYGEGDNAVVVDIPKGAYVKVKVSAGGGDGDGRPAPDRF